MTLTVAASGGLFVFGAWFLVLWGLDRIETAEAIAANAIAERDAAERDLRLEHNARPGLTRVVENPAAPLTDEEFAEFMAATDATAIRFPGRPRLAARADTCLVAA